MMIKQDQQKTGKELPVKDYAMSMTPWILNLLLCLNIHDHEVHCVQCGRGMQN